MSKNLPHQVGVWVTSEELKAIDQACETEYFTISRSGWLRKLIAIELRRVKDGE